MTTGRKTLLLLMLVLGALAIAMLGVLASVYFHERSSGILAQNELERLKTAQIAKPDDAALKESIRDLDEKMRAEYFANRRRFKWAAYILIALAIVWILAAQRFFAQPAPRTAPPRRSTPSDGSRAAWVVTVLLAGLFVSLLYGARASLLQHKEPDKAAALPVSPPAETATPPNWPCLRGPGNIGVAGEGDWPTSWSLAGASNVLWKTPIPFESNSSPIVWDNKIFLTGATKSELRVMCFDRSTGAMLWNVPVAGPDLAKREFKVTQDAGYAASTPATDGKRVYAVFAAGIVAAFDFDGKQAWVRDLGVPKSAYGFASSLICAQGYVILQFDQGADPEERLSQLVALSPDTGETRWSVPRPVANSWATPALIPGPNGEQLIACGAPWAIAYDLKTPREIWRVQFSDGYVDIAPSPAFGASLVFVTNDGAELLAIRPDGAGDVTQSHVAWRSDYGMPDIASPVSNGKRVLQVAAGGLLICFDVATGQIAWETTIESPASSSPIVAGDLVYLTTLDGTTHVFDMNGGKYAQRDHGEIGEPVHATPAFVDSHIYIRGAQNLVCIGQRP
jgi:outer membrane protein assembly factor BamB